MAKGQSFLNVPDITARGEIRHLNVVITEPDEDNNVLVVPVCTYRETDGKPWPGQDSSCILNARCHSFIKTKSFIMYRNAKAMNLVDIFNGIQKGRLTKQPDFNISIVQDIQRGAEESFFLPTKYRHFFNYFL